MSDRKECPRCREVIEIYAGMEGFIPQTAADGYQQRIIREMYEAAAGDEKAMRAEFEKV